MGAIGTFWTWHGNTDFSVAKDLAVKGAYTVANPVESGNFLWAGKVKTNGSNTITMPKDSYSSFINFLSSSSTVKIKDDNGQIVYANIESFDADCPNDICSADWQITLSPQASMLDLNSGSLLLQFYQVEK